MFTSLKRVVRRLRSAPGFATVAVLTLGLGIGANTAIFSVVKGVLLEPLPFPSAGELVFMPRPGTDEGDVSFPDAADIRAEAVLFESVAAFAPFWAYDIAGDGEPARVVATVVEPEYFEVLGMQPLIGRTLAGEDNVIGGERVAVLSEGFWRSRLGGDADAVGRTIQLSGEPFTIVGVMPAAFDALQLGTDMWTPAAITLGGMLDQRGTNNLEMIGRLAPDASLARASEELGTITGRLADAYPETNQGKVLEAIPLRDQVVGALGPLLWILFGAVGLVLLVTCVNVANLFLVRATVREQESAVRLALGGSRWRVAGAALAEAAVISLFGGALGVLFASWGTEALLALAPANLPRADAIGLDAGVLGFTFVLSLLTALSFGWVPAMHSTRRDPADLLARGGGRGAAGRGSRVLSGFVVAEVALAALLLVGSGLLVRSFLALRGVDLGFQPENVVVANFVLPESRYGERDVQDATFDRILDGMRAAPGIERAAFAIGVPLANYGAIGNGITFDDRPEPPAGQRPSARIRIVAGDYFDAIGLRVRRGRAFGDGDDGDAPRVAIVNESFAATHWPGEDVIGKRVATLYTPAPEWMTIVGVVADVKQTSVDGTDVDAIYVPYPQRQIPWARFGTLVARGPVGAATISTGIQGALWAVDPTVPLDAITPMPELVSASIAPRRFASTLITLFAVLALIIAVQGLYGVLSYAVAQRRGEIGVRIALGARTRDVLSLVLRQGGTLALIGLAAGFGLAVFGTRLLGGLLYGIAPTDPPTYVLVGVALIATALAGAAVPAARATRVDPVEALRKG